jgi:HAD superfamily hydrolase (TIGR01509 family)
MGEMVGVRGMNIIFDLGGVVVRWQPEALLARTFDDPAICKVVHSKFLAHPDWPELDRGTLTPADAVARAARRTGLQDHLITNLLIAVPSSLVPIADTVELLYRLKAQGHSLYCLSNMQFASIEFLERTQGFWDVFSGKVISCRVNLCKPEATIYAHLLETCQIDAASALFVDDVEVNLAAARKFGIRTIRFESGVQCAGELKALGCL